jgi:hypothetical protein
MQGIKSKCVVPGMYGPQARSRAPAIEPTKQDECELLPGEGALRWWDFVR